MKIQITQQYTDKILNKNMNVGHEIEVDNERGKLLVEKGYAISLEQTVVNVKRPSKTSKRIAKNGNINLQK